METSECVEKQTRYSVTLAPFQPVTRIELETRVNISIGCHLDIKNPTDKVLIVNVTKAPDTKRRIILNLNQLNIPGNNNGTIFIEWSPKEAGCWRDVLQLTDSRRVKYDIVIATVAKDDKKKISRKLLRSTLSNPTVISVPIQNARFCQDKKPMCMSTKLSIITAAAQTRQDKQKSNWNKENIPSKHNGMEIHLSERENNKKLMETRSYEYHKSKNILSQENSNTWNDGSILPQTLLSLNMPQDIRRATYVKETKLNTDILYENSKELNEDTYTKDQSQSNFSVLLDKLTFASTDVINSSKSVEVTNSQVTEGCHSARNNRTFAVDHKTFEISKVSDTEIDNIDLPSALHPREWSFKDDMKNLVASSPLQNHDPSKNEQFRCRTDYVNRSVQTDYEYFSYETISKRIVVSKKAEDMYIEISPPRKHSFCKSPLLPRLLSRTTLRSTKTGKITKDKSLYEGRNARKATKNIPAIRISKPSLDNLRRLKIHASASKELSVRMQNEENSFIYEAFGLDPFAPSTTENPFLENTVLDDDQWLVQQELIFTKWLNALLSAPEDLYANVDNAIADTVKVLQVGPSRRDCNKDIHSDVATATEKTASIGYNTNSRLYTIRKAAHALFHRAEVEKVNSHITRCVVEGMLYIRLDRNLHRNLSLQKEVLNLFLCYNPLWLRVGLEIIYDEYIPLRNNNDLIGLTRFLSERFFTNPRLTKMSGYHKTDPSKKFVTLLNQFMLKKFLFLVYFLDYAKQHKLIGHDPCLFHKRAIHKTSRDILLHFSRELLAGIGDVTKMLRTYDYIVTHQQTYIDEYDYAVTDIRNDLRDGIRLCRAMELITGIKELTRQCRAPAISRLQKIHNVDVALIALRRIGHILAGDIDAKSIVDGHRKKTLSLLWQIMHKYQAPKFERAARVIQKWWRSQMWYIRVRNYLDARRNYAAIVIQRTWKCKMKRRQVIATERSDFLRARKAAICLQRWWRWLRTNGQLEKLHELKNRRETAAITLQRKWRATLLMRTQREEYRKLRTAALVIQTYWRVRAMKLQRAEYRRNAAVRIQSWWRSTKVTREKRAYFLRCRKSARIIQVWWLRRLLVRNAARTIERWWISVNTRMKYLRLRSSVVFIQKTWRKYQQRKRERQSASLKIQTWWRMMSCSRKYKLKKFCCIKLQRWWRERQRYLKQRRAASLIGSWYLHAKSGRIVQLRYLRMKRAAIEIQNWWRAKLLARVTHERYCQLRRSTIILQTYWRRRILARQDRQRFLSKRRTCVILQSWWRMIRVRRSYKRYRISALTVQRRWRAIKLGHLVRKDYQEIQANVIVIQARWRGFVARKWFLTYRQAVIRIQSYYRMRIAAQRYENLKRATSIIQFYWRRYKQRKELSRQQDFLSIAEIIQNEYGDIALGIDQKAIDTKHMFLGNDYWQEKISVLRNCDSVGALLTCLNSLDTVTKLSPMVCIILCQLNLVDEIHKIIMQRNRSQPWMNVCLRVCNILITLAKYPYTRKYIVKHEHTPLLVKLLSDTLKEKQVFLHCATLIWLLSQDNNYIKIMMMRSDIIWLLKNIQQKILKDKTTAKTRKLEKSNYELDRSSTCLFTNISTAIAAIVKRICT